jgi:hypothetical protein
MKQVQERISSKPSAHLKVILLVANDATRMNSLVQALSQDGSYRLDVF